MMEPQPKVESNIKQHLMWLAWYEEKKGGDSLGYAIQNSYWKIILKKRVDVYVIYIFVKKDQKFLWFV